MKTRNAFSKNLAKKIFHSVCLAIVVCVVYIILLYCYPEWIYNNEWKSEQANFEAVYLNGQEEITRVQASITHLEKFEQMFAFTVDELDLLLSTFLNGTDLSETTYRFYWSRPQCIQRMFGNAFMFFDENSLPFSHIGTRICMIFFRGILPIFATFAMGTGVSALNTIFLTILRPFHNVQKYEIWTETRNRITKRRDVIMLGISVLYFVFALITGGCVFAHWQNISFVSGIRRTIITLASLSPTVNPINANVDAYIYGVMFLHINTALSFFIFSIYKLDQTWKHCQFAVPVMEEVADAYKTDIEVLKMKREKRKKMFEGKLENVK